MAAVAILGTDTGVGKTRAARALLDRLIDAGKKAIAIKPYVSGEEEGVFADLEILGAGVGSVTPGRFRKPLSPYGAIRRGEPAVAMEAVLEYCDARLLSADYAIVEGIGGVMVPLESGTTWLDFHERYGWPSIVIARAGLGTINHSLLSLNAVIERSIPVAGFILNAAEPIPLIEMQENAAIISEFSSAPCLGMVPYADAPFDEWKRCISNCELTTIFSVAA